MTDILFDVFTDEEGEPVLKGNDCISNVVVKFDRAAFGELANKAQRNSAAAKRLERLGGAANRKLAEGKFEWIERFGSEYREVFLAAKEVVAS
jgi:hypothetical protein